ncbi:MAG TPA: asparagine synthase (glutamine-hydrolyzing) [Roseomonas sp.]|jgi:asparagine synthase (glutamine-hydrolysing)
MSGIAGLALRGGARPSMAMLAAMGAALAHRGPDGGGQHVSGQVALTHLAIAGLPNGDQPVLAGSAALVADGVICNDRALRDAHGFACATDSAWEPPLHLYRRDGISFADGLRGMYAIALHDPAERRLVLARDPFGIKPLYIAEFADGIAFASEPQALLAAGVVPPALDPARLAELLQLQFTTGAETIFRGISRVLPGETIAIADGRVVERRRRAALPEGGPETITEDAALARLHAALAESVALHRRTDGPQGMLLSGGVGAAAILAVQARLSARPVLAFSAGFEAPGAAEERAAAAAIAMAAGARHVVVEVTRAETWRHLPAIVAAMDDPAADYAIIPAWFLARRARQDVKMLLSAEGADEIFGGYGRYRSAMRSWWLGGKAPRRKGAFDGLDLLRTEPTGWRDGIAAAEVAAGRGGRSRLQGAQALDIADWLPNDPLAKLDRCLMAHAVEGRAPFLDPAIADAVFRLPDALKVRRDMGKHLLRRWLQLRFPPADPFRPKQGFAVPIGAWIAEDGARLGALVAAQPGVAEIARPDRVQALFRAAAGKKEGFAAWHLLFHALWHRRHVEGRGMLAGDVFEVLAER